MVTEALARTGPGLVVVPGAGLAGVGGAATANPMKSNRLARKSISVNHCRLPRKDNEFISSLLVVLKIRFLGMSSAMETCAQGFQNDRWPHCYIVCCVLSQLEVIQTIMSLGSALAIFLTILALFGHSHYWVVLSAILCREWQVRQHIVLWAPLKVLAS